MPTPTGVIAKLAEMAITAGLPKFLPSLARMRSSRHTRTHYSLSKREVRRN